MGLEAAELARWTRFAAKGGIGKCTATCDCVAESPDDLMFLKDDAITVLLQIQDMEGYYLGYCEGVVGRFSGADVHFHSKLKKPVMTKRSSTHSTLAAHPPSTLPKSPTPTTPTSVMHFDGTSSGRSSSARRMGKADASTSTSGHHSRSQTPLASVPPLDSSTSFVRVNSGSVSRKGSLEVHRGGGGNLGSPIPREYHLGGSENGEERAEDSDSGVAAALSSTLADVEQSIAFTRALSSTPPMESSQASPTSSSPSSSSFQHHSSPPRRHPNIPTPLNLHPLSHSSADVEASAITPPLRIMKRMPSNPGSPLPPGRVLSPLAQQAFGLPSSDVSGILSASSNPYATVPESANSDASLVSDTSATSNATTTTAVSVSTIDTSTLIVPNQTNHSPLSTFSDTTTSSDPADTPPPSALPSALDTSTTSDSTYDDLTRSHPGRFSRFSMGPSLALPALLGIAPPQPVFPPTPVQEKEEDQVVLEPGLFSSSSRNQSRGSLSLATRGRVSEAALASTQAQVGIGLSLLQDLVGGMGSDSDSGSEYEDSDEDTGQLAEAGKPSDRRSRYAGLGGDKTEAEVEAEAYAAAFGRVAGQNERVSVAASEGSTLEGLMYASTEDDHRQIEDSVQVLNTSPSRMADGPASPNSMLNASPIAHDFNPALLSPTTSPTGPYFPNTLSHKQQPQTVDANSSTNIVGRDRRPSLAPSVVSGKSGFSGTSGSWDGDIYDNYRYSRFSAQSRPSMDSARTRTDSGAAAERQRSGSASTGRSMALAAPPLPEDPELPQGGPSALKTGTMQMIERERARDRSMSVDSQGSEASVYTQNSRLSTLSRDIAVFALPPVSHEAQSSGSSASSSRPPPLLLSRKEDGVPPKHSPLLHTNWASPTSPSTAGLQTALPPLTAGAHTPHPGFVGAAVPVRIGRAVLVKEGEDNGDGEDGDSRRASEDQQREGRNHGGSEDGSEVNDGRRSSVSGVASALRQRLEGRKSEEKVEQVQGYDSSMASYVSGAGLGNGIVVEDEEELPSRILEDDGEYEDGETFVEDNGSRASGRMMDSPETVEVEGGIQDKLRSVRDSPEPEVRIGRLAPLVVANRTPSPLLRDEDEDEEPRNKRPTFSMPPPPATSPPPTHSQSPVLPVSPSQTFTPSQPSHLRPQNTLSVNPQERRSLFLPHPNAPKAPAGAPLNIVPGAGIGAVPQGHPMTRSPPLGQGPLRGQGPHPPYQEGPLPQNYPKPPVQAVIHMALSTPPRVISVPGKPPTQRAPTIYGRTDVDLSTSIGPVPITFSLDPPPLGSGRATAPKGVLPQIGAGGQRNPISSLGPVPPPPSQPNPPPSQQSMQRQPPLRSFSSSSSLAATPEAVPQSMPPATSSNPNSNVNDQNPSTTNVNAPIGMAPIPRANFAPKAAGLRPRSRSFSGFNTTEPRGASTNDSSAPSAAPANRESARPPPKRTLSSSVSIGSFSSHLGSQNVNLKAAVKTSPLRPSPLSISSVNGKDETARSSSLKPLNSPSIKSPSSPLAQSVFIAPPRSPLLPSPLHSPAMPLSNSLSTSLTSPGESATRGPPSPALARSPSPTAISVGLAQRGSLRPRGSRATLQDATSDSASVISGISRPATISRTTLDNTNGTSSRPSSPYTLAPAQGQMRSSSMQVVQRKASDSSSPSVVLGPGRVSVDAQVPPAAGTVRQNSLRSKLSLPNLRRNQSRSDDDGASVLALHAQEQRERAENFVFERDREGSMDRAKEVVQVQDTEFELVRPNISQLQPQPRTSEDSTLVRRDASFDSRADNGSFLRPESPAISVSSGARSPVMDFPPPPSTLGSQLDPSWTPQQTESPASIEAHRQRETKWVSLMSSSPASLSRKSKKVRKLLIEGVPSSVRYLIWSYLTDGKGRAVKGVYEQLCKRGEVSRTRDIAVDVEQLFGAGVEGGNEGTAHLSGTKGSVIVLLQAYFAMVPDVQYSIGLTKIVGQLLLLSPEEDAFWIFTSIMDTHIRPYFSALSSIPPASSATSFSLPRSTQMEVDASLFSRALEANDATLAKKLFVDLGILPGAICQTWFSSLFVGTLPPDYVNRVWDIFLYDGIPFLLRVALSLTLVCRRFILSSTSLSETSTLTMLAHPPPAWLPPTPEAFLTAAMSVKVKDEDVRKQRVKMGEMVKRQTQAQQMGNGVSHSGISLPRS